MKSKYESTFKDMIENHSKNSGLMMKLMNRFQNGTSIESRILELR